MPQWEYRCWTAARWLDEKELNAFGQEGWELVGITTLNEYIHYVFRRPAHYPGS